MMTHKSSNQLIIQSNLVHSKQKYELCISDYKGIRKRAQTKNFLLIKFQIQADVICLALALALVFMLHCP